MRRTPPLVQKGKEGTASAVLSVTTPTMTLGKGGAMARAWRSEGVAEGRREGVAEGRREGVAQERALLRRREIRRRGRRTGRVPAAHNRGLGRARGGRGVDRGCRNRTWPDRRHRPAHPAVGPAFLSTLEPHFRRLNLTKRPLIRMGAANASTATPASSKLVGHPSRCDRPRGDDSHRSENGVRRPVRRSPCGAGE